MPEEAPYTQPRQYQFRGPTDSADYNARVDENYDDLANLTNRTRRIENRQSELFRQSAQDQLGLQTTLEALKTRVEALEATQNKLHFHSLSQVDNDRFNSTAFAVPSSSRCNVDQIHGVMTLPLVSSSSLSKLFYVNSEGLDVLPSTFEARVMQDTSSADNLSAVIDTTDPVTAAVRQAGRIWERNVSVTATDSDGAILTVYYKVPTDLYTTEKSNCVILHPYPAYGPDVMSIDYTTSTSVLMQDSDGYIPLNSTTMHSGNTSAVGWLPPGAWSGDEALNCAPRIYYFNPRVVTGLRIKLRQRKYYTESGKYVYSYGLSSLDLRYDKFLTTGKAMIRFDAPSGDTISSVTDVQPQIWNLSGSEWSSVFSTRVLWETSLNSGVYTETPVALSSRVWVEVTLKESAGKGTPALSGMTISYT